MESLSVEEDINICDNFAFFFSVLIFFWWGGFGKKIVFATFYPWIKVLFLCLNFLGDIFPILRLFGYLLCTPATAAPFPLDVSDNTIHLHTDTIIRSQWKFEPHPRQYLCHVQVKRSRPYWYLPEGTAPKIWLLFKGVPVANVFYESSILTK